MAVKEGEQPEVSTHVGIECGKLAPPFADRGIIQPQNRLISGLIQSDREDRLFVATVRQTLDGEAAI
jgi:hypothetical protein